MTNGHLPGKTRGAHSSSYPVQAEVEYRLKQGKRIVEVGHTQTLSLSGREVVLDSGHHLPPGMEIELFLTWPGPLGTLGRLVLHVQGRTEVGRGARTKVAIGQYDFETRPDTKPSAKPKPVKTIGATTLPHAAPFAS